jgi:hypothetical protein
MFKKTQRKVFLAFFVTFLSACGTPSPFLSYSGDRLPQGMEASISGGEKKGFSILIVCVNGKSTSGMWGFYKYPFEAVLKPGKNYLGFMYSENSKFYIGKNPGSIFSVSDFWFEAEAGGLYQVQAEPKGNQVRFGVLDTKKNVNVGGPDISAPPPVDEGSSCRSVVEKIRKEGRSL